MESTALAGPKLPHLQLKLPKNSLKALPAGAHLDLGKDGCHCCAWSGPCSVNLNQGESALRCGKQFYLLGVSRSRFMVFTWGVGSLKKNLFVCQLHNHKTTYTLYLYLLLQKKLPVPLTGHHFHLALCSVSTRHNSSSSSITNKVLASSAQTVWDTARNCCSSELEAFLATH